jgi:citrate synthase
MKHSYLHENLIGLLQQFRYDAHPMGMVISTLAALSTFYPGSNPALNGEELFDKKNGEGIRNKQIYRLLGKLPTIAACAYRHRIGKPYNYPNSNLGYTENFLFMLDKLDENDYRPHPVLARALDKLFIIHADHELNCSTAAMRHIASSKVDPYTAMAGAAGALYGPLHGGACEAVLDMLESIGTKENVPKFIEAVKKREKKLMGFGHRVYKSYDPRAKIARSVADEVFAVLEKEPLIEVAIELEKQALSDPYFKERSLYPNVDFYTGVVYRAMGFPTDMFPVLFTIPRAAGWLAHWLEGLDDPDTKIYRPRQVFLGEPERSYLQVHRRTEPKVRDIRASVSQMSKRRTVPKTKGL